MGISEKVWDALTTVIKMNDKVEQLAETVKSQQLRIEDLTMRVVRLKPRLKSHLYRKGRKGLRKSDGGVPRVCGEQTNRMERRSLKGQGFEGVIANL